MMLTINKVQTILVLHVKDNNNNNKYAGGKTASIRCLSLIKTGLEKSIFTHVKPPNMN